MDSLKNYDDIRPYNDDEVSSVIHDLISDIEFLMFLRYLFPHVNKNDIIEKLSKIKTTYEFQTIFSYAAMKVIMARTISEFSSSGIDNISTDKHYLFISNHRDIALDSALLNVTIHENGFAPSQTAIGSNLLVSPFVTHMMKLNKSFIVHRNLPQRQLYLSSKTLSNYLYDTIIGKVSSIWLAQREGRTKDGNDRTNPGLLKMLTMYDSKNPIDILVKLNIVPISISYEFEPCDGTKTYEIYCNNNDIPYVKTPEQELNNVVSGMISPKGNVHINFGKPLVDKIEELRKIQNTHNIYTTLAEMIDKEIHENYKLWPNNYIAYDLLNTSNEFSKKYDDNSKNKFLNHISSVLEKLKGDKIEMEKILIRLYANPVINKLG